MTSCLRLLAATIIIGANVGRDYLLHEIIFSYVRLNLDLPVGTPSLIATSGSKRNRSGVRFC